MYELDQLINVDQLWQCAREGTGRGVSVAILDTGVEADHPALAGAVRSCQEVVPVGRSHVCRGATDGDLVGHGTACAGIIHDLAPDAELHSMRVIGRNSNGTIEQLIHGLRWAIREKFDVVNLSLGTVQKRHLATLHELVDEAYFQGQLLVAAANNQRQISYPAQFASLIAVDNEAFQEPLEFHYRLGRAVELVARGIYVHAPSPGGKYRWFTGTSFACPHITGLIARLKSVIPDIQPLQMKALLWCLRGNRENGPVDGARPLDQATAPTTS